MDSSDHIANATTMRGEPADVSAARQPSPAAFIGAQMEGLRDIEATRERSPVCTTASATPAIVQGRRRSENACNPLPRNLAAESVPSSAPTKLSFPLARRNQSLPGWVDGHDIVIDATGHVRAGGNPVMTLEGHEVIAVEGVPMAGGQTVTLGLDGRVFVGQKPNIEKDFGPHGGRETLLTTNLPLLRSRVPIGFPMHATASSSLVAQANVRALYHVFVLDSYGKPIFKASGLDTGNEKHGVLRFIDGTVISAYENATGLKKFVCNCHGYTMTGGKFSIDNRDFQEWLERTTLVSKTNTNTPRLGDLVVYRNCYGNVVHSAVLTDLTEPRRVTMASGDLIYTNDAVATPPGGITGESKITTVPVEEGWKEPETSIEYWRVATSNDPASAE